MSFEMTFRQKLIRITASAAICGLSFSFVIGESVDQEARFLRSWVVDPSFIPIAYHPLRPVTAALASLSAAGWRENLVALNSIPSTLSPSVEPPSPLLFTASADPVPPVIDRVSNVSAVETKTVALVPVPVPVKIPAPSIAKKEALKIPVRENLPEVGVQTVLGSIHSAARRISSPAVAVTDVPVATNNSWILQGRVLASTAQSEAGHYEVGLFAKVDPDGMPVGYPIIQQILPAGQTTFKLKVSAKIERGYLFGELVAAKTGKRTWIAPPMNPWEKGSTQLAELYLPPGDTLKTASAIAVREAPQDSWRVQGTIGTLFSPAGTTIPQADVVVKIRGRKEATRTDKKGAFSLELPRMRGTLFLEILKPGYHPTIVGVNAEDSLPLRVDIASRHAVDQISQHLGTLQASTKGIFLGRASTAEGANLSGMTAQLSLKADGPFYFNDDGQPSRDAKATSGADGRFLFLNVEAGVGYMETALGGDSIAPIQISTVDGGELVLRQLVPMAGPLRGRLFNPVAGAAKMLPVGGARVRMEGSTDWVTTDSYGAFSVGPVRWIRGERVALELSAERFNNHRYLVSAENQAAPLNLFAFPASYIARLAQSMDVDIDPYAGLVIGKVAGPSVRIDALADHSPVNNAKDFYFDSKGRLHGSHEMTDPKFGTFMIFNVPKGRALLQGSDGAGKLKYSEAIYSSPSSVSVVME